MTYQRKEQIGDAVLYLGDCLDVMPGLGKVDAVVTDPPYGINYIRGAGGKNSIHTRKEQRHGAPIIGDDRRFDPMPFLQWPCLLFGADHYLGNLPNDGVLHVWDKHCGRGSNDDFSDAELFWTSWGCKRRVLRHLWKGVLQDGPGEKRFHTAQKPLRLMVWCLEMIKGHTILDPFMGSGTTGVACAKLGRRFIGVEIEPKYFDIACKRIEDAYKQPDLFIERPRPVQEAMAL